MVASFLVTLRAIAEYLMKAREAKQKLDEAAEQMNRAAEELCSKWQGDAAMAFAEEQKVLYGYCRELSGVGEEYMTVLDKVRQRYADAEEAVNNAIRG